MRLVWTYSRDFKRGSLNNKSEEEYIQWLFKKSITSSPDIYEKIIYTDKENVGLFKDIVDKIIIREKKDFIFLADLKFDVSELLQGEFLILDGDLIINKPLIIPPCDFAFEYQGKIKPKVKELHNILLSEGVSDKVPVWGTNNDYYYNLGLMYFNNDLLKEKLLYEYRSTQNYFIEHIEPKYGFNKRNIQFSACGSQILVKQFELNNECNIEELKHDNVDSFTHYGHLKKLDLMNEFRPNKLI